MRFYAPYSGFRTTVVGRELRFPQGVMEVGPKDKKTIALLKRIPIEMGEITDPNGKVINKPKAKSKTAKKAETGDKKNVLQSKNKTG